MGSKAEAAKPSATVAAEVVARSVALWGHWDANAGVEAGPTVPGWGAYLQFRWIIVSRVLSLRSSVDC